MLLANGYVSKFSIFDLLIQSRTVLMTQMSPLEVASVELLLVK